MEDITDFKVKFTKTENDLSPHEIQLIVSGRSWADLGFKFSCRCKLINPQNNNIFYFESFIGFLRPKNQNDVEFELFNHYKDSFEDIYELIQHCKKNNNMKNIRFFTMLPTMMDYRKAVDELGPDVLAKVLGALNDLVYHKDQETDWFTEAVESKVFNLGFMRHSEPFFAYNNADSVLGGVEEEKFDGISQDLTLKYKLEGFKNNHEIKFNYKSSSCIPKRINILIGKNGLGKSQALRAFCRAALRYDDKSTSLSDNVSGGRPMINRLLAIATPGETQNTFPGERIKTQKLYYRRLSLTRRSRAKASKSIGEMLIQLVRSEEKIGNTSRWELFKNAISQVIPLPNIVISLNDKTAIPLIDLHSVDNEQALQIWDKVVKNSDPKIRFRKSSYALSSGQLTYFKFALLCCLYIENGSFVLLDEPETHMHPNMIADFVGILDYLLEYTGSQALIATHSAYFVREVSREQVHIFTRESDNISIVPPRLRTFGADVDSISQFIFDEDVDNRLVDKIYAKVKNLPFAQVQEELEAELSMSAMLNLKSRMVD